jgi:hypothetical protein
MEYPHLHIGGEWVPPRDGSDDASFVTGIALPVDGGFIAR